MIINRDKHNKYVVGWTPTINTATSNDTSSGGTTYVYVGGGGSSGSSGSSMATLNSFAFYRVSDGETTIILAATIPQDTANLVIKGDDNVLVTMVTEPTIFESLFVSTGTNKGVYKISYEKVTTYPEGEDSSNEEQEPIISYPLILTYVSGDKILASHFDTLRLYKKVILTTEEGEVEVEQEVKNYSKSALTIDGDTAGINTITIDLYDPDSLPITFSRLALTYTEGEETTDILSFEVTMLTKAIMLLTAKKGDSYWKLDEEGNLYTEYNAYSIKELSAYGLGSGDTPSSGGTSYLHELLDVDAKNPTNGAILLYNTSTRKWEATTGGSFATQSWVNTQIELLVGAAPDVLDTLEELADALGNDPNFATTVTTMITDLDERVEVLEQLLDWFSFVDGRVRVNYGFFGVREISAYGAGSGEPTSGVAYLRELKDVSLTDLQDDQLLMYNADTRLWVNVDKDLVGLNESQLLAYLIRNNYAKRSDITWSNVSGKPSIFNTTLSYINDLNASWRDLLAQSPSEHVTRWPAFAEITNTPTTLSGYGITDAYTKTETDDRYVNVTGDTMTGDLALPNMSATGYIQIGSARLEYDSTNNALKLSTSTGGIINFYSTGEVAAYGYDNTGSVSISLEDLDNVVISSLTNGQVLQWDGTNWVNGTVESGLDESALADYLTLNQYITQTTADGRYALKDGSNATGTWPISITGNAATATKLALQDTRIVNTAPFAYGKGLVYHFKYNATDGLNDGGIYHSVLQFDQWEDPSGGLCKQLALTDNGNMWFRNASSATAWGAWKKLLDSSNYTSYTVTKTGGGASGTWGINVSGSAAVAGRLSSTYTGYGGNQPPSYFNGMGLKVNMMSIPVQYSDVVVVNGYNGGGNDVPYINAIAFQKASGTHGEVYHASGNYGASSWKTWYNFLDSGNYTNYTVTKTGSGASGTWPISISGNADTVDNLHSTALFRRNVQWVLSNTNAKNLYKFGLYLNATGNGSGNSNFPASYGILVNFAYNDDNYRLQLHADTAPALKYSIKFDAIDTGWYTLARTTDNVASATKLQTARSLWGNTFDGTQNLTGRLTAAGMTCGYSNTSYAISTTGLISNGWLRTVGPCGWYSETYGGGWYMADTNWLRAHNGKGIYTPAEMQCGAFHMTGYSGSRWQNGKGALNVQIYNNSEQTPLIVAYRRGYSYTGTGANRLFSMELLNNGSMMYLNFGGAMRYYLTNGGNFVATGEVTAYSDIRLKSNITNLIYRGRLQPKCYIKNNKESIGFIALEVQKLYPELVLECNDEHHYLALNYGNITAVLSALINLVEDEVTELKNRVQQLELRLSKYEDV